MPVILALIALLVVLAAPPAVTARDLDATGATPDVVIEIGASVDPQEVRVPAGSVVGWVNRDGERHRVRSRSGPAEFDSGNLERGERFAVRLTAPGTYAYLDDRDREASAYHGRIIVTAASEAGGSEGDGDGAATPPTSVAASIGDRVFDPGSIAVAVGGTVTWANVDDRPHTVTAADGAFDSGVMDQGGTFRQRFETAGTYAFLCALHPEMQGEVQVVGASAPVAPPPVPATTPQPVSTPAPTPVATEPGTTAQGGAPTIEMQDFAFAPERLTVTEGAVITVANVGAAPHTATADDGSFDTALVAAGATSEITVGGPGTYAFVCTFHPDMRGAIEVVAEIGSASAPPVAAAGNVASGAPPGPVDQVPATLTEASALDGLVRLMIGVALVSIAAALFARTINGTVRRPGRSEG